MHIDRFELSKSAPVWPDSITDADLAELGAPTFSALNYDDPIEISRHANESFSNKQYDRAAELYALLLPFDPGNVDTYNNLGITLHYLGRPSEALARLREGVAVDPGHQRIRLTLGFVNSQLGNIQEARTALTTATALGADNEVGRSAAKMLESLP